MAPRMICALLMRIRCVTGGEKNLCAQVSEGRKAEGKHSPIHCKGKRMPLSKTQGFITSMKVRMRVMKVSEWVAGRLPGF